VAIATTGSVYTFINSLRLSQHPSIWLLRHDASCFCKMQTRWALNVVQTAVNECKWLGNGKLCNATRCDSISSSPTLADNRDVLEHCNVEKQHLVKSVRGTHKGDFERGMLKQRPTYDIKCSNWYQVREQVDTIMTHFIQSAMENIAELYDLHHCESAVERLEFIDSLFPVNKYLFPVAEHVEGGVHGPNPTQR